MPFTTIKTEELIHEKKQKDKAFAYSFFHRLLF